MKLTRRHSGLAGGFSTGEQPGQQTATNCRAGTVIYMAGRNSPCPNGYVFSRNTSAVSGSPAKTECQCIGVSPSPPPPPAPAPAPIIRTTVSPQIQVSPQVSPIFQQQFQPTGSPISAGTSQTSPAVQNPVTQAPAQQPVNFAPMMDDLKNYINSLIPAAPVIQPQQPVIIPTTPTIPAAVPQTVYAPQQPAFTMPVSAPANMPQELPQTFSSQELPGFPTASAASVTDASKPASNNMGLLIAVGLIGALFMMKGSEK